MRFIVLDFGGWADRGATHSTSIPDIAYQHTPHLYQKSRRSMRTGIGEGQYRTLRSKCVAGYSSTGGMSCYRHSKSLVESGSSIRHVSTEQRLAACSRPYRIQPYAKSVQGIA
eukprot:3330520-Rhodomonas_salina.1